VPTGHEKNAPGGRGREKTNVAGKAALASRNRKIPSAIRRKFPHAVGAKKLSRTIARTKSGALKRNTQSLHGNTGILFPRKMAALANTVVQIGSTAVAIAGSAGVFIVTRTQIANTNRFLKNTVLPITNKSAIFANTETVFIIAGTLLINTEPGLVSFEAKSVRKLEK
jgi:hypothetical protein